jgi:hypothetical protein
MPVSRYQRRSICSGILGRLNVDDARYESMKNGNRSTDASSRLEIQLIQDNATLWVLLCRCASVDISIAAYAPGSWVDSISTMRDMNRCGMASDRPMHRADSRSSLSKTTLHYGYYCVDARQSISASQHMLRDPGSTQYRPCAIRIDEEWHPIDLCR